MTYIELINEFWKQDRFDPTQALDAKFYFYLLDECNKRQWINPFELQSRITEISLMITRKTIGEVRNRLKQRGLIDFVAAPNKPTIYRISNVDDSPDNRLLNCFLQGTIKKPLKVQLGNISGDNSETLLEDIRLKTEDKEKPPKGGKKKTNESIPDLIKRYRAEAVSENYRTFLDWTVEKLPYVSQHIPPMSEKEFGKLKAAFGSQAIVDNLLNLENRKDLRKRYTSLYLTLINWCKRGQENQ